jgi:hypothetical protein
MATQAVIKVGSIKIKLCKAINSMGINDIPIKSVKGSSK